MSSQNGRSERLETPSCCVICDTLVVIIAYRIAEEPQSERNKAKTRQKAQNYGECNFLIENQETQNQTTGQTEEILGIETSRSSVSSAKELSTGHSDMQEQSYFCT